MDYLHRQGRVVELMEKEFAVGRWEQALEAIQAAPAPPEAPPQPTGAAKAAVLLSEYL